MFIFGFVLVIAPALLFAGYKILAQQKADTSLNMEPEMSPPPLQPFGSLDSDEKIKNTEQFNVLLLGYGGAGHEGGFLTDAIMLVHFDIKNKKMAFISVPRDLWVKLPDGRQTKINAAFVAKDTPVYPKEEVSLDEALTGAVKAKSVIEDVTGLEPHFYIGIDFNKFKTVIDKLGGIDVDVPEITDDPWYPVTGKELDLCDHTPEEVTKLSNTLSGFELEKQFPCRYEHLHFEKKVTHMNGETALKFVRSRHGSSDFSRSRRQQAVLLAVRDVLLSKKVLVDPVGIFKQFSGSVRTNLNENLVKNIATVLLDIKSYSVSHVTLTTENVLATSTSSAGAFILVPKESGWTGVRNYIQNELNKNKNSQ